VRGGNRKVRIGNENGRTRRGMYVGMRMDFVGRENEKGKHDCARRGNRKVRTWNVDNGLCEEEGIRKSE
jgi:hypothetical protein